MGGVTTLTLRLAAGGAALLLVAATQTPTLGETQPGIWEISGLPGAKGPIRQCVADVTALAHFEHRSKACSTKIIKSAGSMTSVEYRCGAAGFGHSDIEVITPRSLRISTQGISGGLPFNYVLQAHRIDDCQKVAPLAAH